MCFYLNNAGYDGVDGVFLQTKLERITIRRIKARLNCVDNVQLDDGVMLVLLMKHVMVYVQVHALKLNSLSPPLSLSLSLSLSFFLSLSLSGIVVELMLLSSFLA
jgi:hypothetical protein